MKIDIPLNKETKPNLKFFGTYRCGQEFSNFIEVCSNIEKDFSLLLSTVFLSIMSAVWHLIN